MRENIAQISLLFVHNNFNNLKDQLLLLKLPMSTVALSIAPTSSPTSSSSLKHHFGESPVIESGYFGLSDLDLFSDCLLEPISQQLNAPRSIFEC